MFMTAVGRKRKEIVTLKRSTDNFRPAECQYIGDLLALLGRARICCKITIISGGSLCIYESAQRAAGGCSAQDSNWDKNHYASR